MTERKSPVQEEDLHAYVDGLLSAERRQAVETFLAENPADAERIRVYQRQNETLRIMFDPVLDEPIPPELLRRQRRRFKWLRRAAMVALFLLGGLAGWWGRSAVFNQFESPLAFARDAAVAHIVYTSDTGRPVELGVDQEERLVQWLSNRLGRPLRAPDLFPLGYQLVGGRLLPGGDGPVAQFMYQNSGGSRLTLYIRAGGGSGQGTDFRFVREGQLSVFFWLGEKWSCALSGELEKEKLLHIAQTARDKLYRVDSSGYSYE